MALMRRRAAYESGAKVQDVDWPFGLKRANPEPVVWDKGGRSGLSKIAYPVEPSAAAQPQSLVAAGAGA